MNVRCIVLILSFGYTLANASNLHGQDTQSLIEKLITQKEHTTYNLDAIGRINPTTRTRPLYNISPLATMIFQTEPELEFLQLDESQKSKLKQLTDELTELWKKRDIENLEKAVELSQSMDDSIQHILNKQQLKLCSEVLALREYYSMSLHAYAEQMQLPVEQRNSISQRSKEFTEQFHKELIAIEIDTFAEILKVADPEKAKRFREEFQNITPVRSPFLSSTWLQLCQLKAGKIPEQIKPDEMPYFGLGYGGSIYIDQTINRDQTTDITLWFQTQRWDFVDEPSLRLFLNSVSQETTRIEMKAIADIREMRQRVQDGTLSQELFDELRRKSLDEKEKEKVAVAKDLENELNDSEKRRYKQAQLLTRCQRCGAINGFRSAQAKALGYYLENKDLEKLKSESARLKKQLEERAWKLQCEYFQTVFGELLDDLDLEMSWAKRPRLPFYPPLELRYSELSRHVIYKKRDDN